MQLAMLQQWFKPRKKRQNEMVSEKYALFLEIRKAHADWQLAQQRLDYALDQEEIDYAIYLLEAAETRYEMLIKAAKRAKLSLIDSDFVAEAGS